MNDYLYYCRNCNTLESESRDNATVRCYECNQKMYPLHFTSEDWEKLSDEDKRRTLQQATMPEVSVKRENNQSAQINSRKKISSNNSGTEGKTSGLSIAAFIVSLFGCISFIGLILGIVDLTKNDGRKKGLSIAAVVIGAIMMICSIGLGTSMATSDKKELKSDSVNNISVESTEMTADNNDESATPSVSNEKSTETSQSPSAASEITISEQVLVDQNGVKITAVEYETDSIWGDGIKMLLENNTSQNLMFSCDALIVNDYMITDLFVQSVAAGKSAYETMYLSSSQLRQAGIDNIGKIEMYFRIYDNDTWEDLFKTDCVTLQTSDYASMDDTIDIEGTELYNKNDIRIIAKYVDENSFWGKAILLYVENKTDNNITVSVDDLSINGFMFSPLYSDTIYSGKKSFDDITLLSTELEENGVTEVKDIELKFRIYNSETYDDIDNTDVISFTAD